MPTFDWHMLIDMKLNRTGHGSVLEPDWMFHIHDYLLLKPPQTYVEQTMHINEQCTVVEGHVTYATACKVQMHNIPTYMHTYINND